MLIKESVWLGNNIKSLNPNNVFPMLDLGSNSRKYREKLQPWIEKNIFKEPKRLGFKIIYTDQKNLPGVDLVGNIYNPKFQEKLSKLKIKSIMCSNLLEHIEDRESLAKFITKILPKQGYLFLSGPYRYRHHGDPIDTMFRPTVDELHQLFPTLKKIKGEIITDYTYTTYLLRTPFVFIKSILRLFLPFYNPRGWITNVGHLSWLNKKYKATCIVLKKE